MSSSDCRTRPDTRSTSPLLGTSPFRWPAFMTRRVWWLATAWVPTVREAIHHLPEQGAIRNGELTSPRTSREPLASGSYLTFVLAADDRADRVASRGLRVEFHKRNLQVCSLFGCAVMDYPKVWRVEFNRRELESWWGA